MKITDKRDNATTGQWKDIPEGTAAVGCTDRKLYLKLAQGDAVRLQDCRKYVADHMQGAFIPVSIEVIITD